MPYTPEPSRQLSHSVASYVREQIVSGKKRKGEFFRIEAIANAMQVSSTPVREGLFLLQLEGFVRLVPRRGFQVMGFSRQDVRDIFWSQALLAAELTARATRTLTDEQVDQLQDLVDRYEAARKAGNEPETTRLGHEFHRTINKAARSPRLAHLLGTMTKQLPNRFYGAVEGQVQGACDYHSRILEAMKRRDVEEARRLMTEHIEDGGNMLVEHLETQGIWDEPADVPA